MTASVKTILVRAPNWIGDQILAYPFFHYLRQAYPEARITSVCVPWVEAIQFRNLVDDVYVLPKVPGRSFLSRARKLETGARALRARGHWDLGIALPNSFSSAWLLFRAGARARRGYLADGRGLLLNQSLPAEEGEGIHRAQAYVNLLPRGSRPTKPVFEFWGVPPEGVLNPGVPGVLPQFDPERAWPQAKPIEPPTEPFWILAPGSTAQSRRWPIERFAAIARDIYEQTRWKGLVVGGPTEAPLAARLGEMTGVKLSDWTARGSVANYWKVFRAARFTLCNDSGLGHMAALCGILERSFVQVVWGAGDPKKTQPLGPARVQILFNPVHCWPCERNLCSQPSSLKLECLRGIEPAALWKEIERAIRSQSEI